MHEKLRDRAVRILEIASMSASYDFSLDEIVEQLGHNQYLYALGFIRSLLKDMRQEPYTGIYYDPDSDTADRMILAEILCRIKEMN